jgi:hypothetical protein
VAFATLVEAAGAALIVHQQAIDTTTPAGRMFFRPATADQGRSRATTARNAPTLTGWRRSGLLAPERSWFSLPCATA